MNNLLKIFLLLLMVCSCGSDNVDDRFYSLSKKFVKKAPDYFLFDPVAGHVHKSNATINHVWPEHKDGKIVLKTNNYGFRRDGDITPDKQGKIRILVTGDSHIDGLINNSESCCAILENLLNKSCHDNYYEVLNSGTAYYCTRNYLGAIKKYLHFNPDIYIVIIYGGNDFIETCKILGCERSLNPLYYIRLRENAWINPGVTQGLNQIYYFKHFPKSQEVAFKSVTEDIKSIEEICSSHKIKLIVLLLPGKVEGEWATDGSLLDRSKEILRLTDNDLQINVKLLDQLSVWLKDEKIDHINLLAKLKGRGSELFWKTDYHLNDKGHKIVAETLFAAYKDKFLALCHPGK